MKKKYKIKNKKMVGGTGEPIKQSDIIYQDELVCILNPEVKKGIIIFSEFTQPLESDSLCSIGLKTGAQLQLEGIKFDKRVFYPYIFFRAPYYSREIDYSTIDTEIYSSFGNIGKTLKFLYVLIQIEHLFFQVKL